MSSRSGSSFSLNSMSSRSLRKSEARRLRRKEAERLTEEEKSRKEEEIEISQKNFDRSVSGSFQSAIDSSSQVGEASPSKMVTPAEPIEVVFSEQVMNSKSVVDKALETLDEPLLFGSYFDKIKEFSLTVSEHIDNWAEATVAYDRLREEEKSRKEEEIEISQKNFDSSVSGSFQSAIDSSSQMGEASPSKMVTPAEPIEVVFSEQVMNSVSVVDKALETLNEPLLFGSFFDKMKEFCLTVSEHIDNWIEATIAYQGFNAVVMRGQLRKKTSVADLFMLVHLGMRRGNQITKISTSIPCKTTRVRLATLKKALGLKDKAAGNPLAVTLSRIIACFPDISTCILQYHDPKMAVPYEALKTIHAEFPAIGRAQCGASVMVKQLTQSDVKCMLAIFMTSSLMTSEIIAVKNLVWKAKTLQEKAKQAEGFVTNAYNSQVITQIERVEICKEFAVIVNDDKQVPELSAAWRAAGKACIAWVSQTYKYTVGHDE